MRKDVDMIAHMTKNGLPIPLTLIWEDGRKFEIEKVLNTQKCASLKGGGMGIRFKVLIEAREKFIWLDEYVWFVEIATNTTTK